MHCREKKRYATEEFAALSAAILEGMRSDRLFWYNCPECCCWHLTRKTKINAPYYTDMKQQMIAKYGQNKTTVIKPITPPTKKEKAEVHIKILQAERDRLLTNFTSLDEIKTWNDSYDYLKIPLKKAAKKKGFTQEQIDDWKAKSGYKD